MLPVEQKDKHLFNGLFLQDNLGEPPPEILIWILMKHEMMGWQWHQLNHLQIVCTSLQTDNHASTSSLIFFATDRTLKK